MNKIAKIKALCEAATRGPWEYDGAGCVGLYDGNNELIFDICECDDLCTENADANGEFIANARESIPYLLSEVERLEYKILAIMHSVDKWFDVVPDTNEETRAGDAREIGLKATERLQAELQKETELRMFFERSSKENIL